MVNGTIQTYTKFEDVPDCIDHVIAFLPEIPPEPHTQEQHDEIDSWQDKFQELMRREYASSGKTG
jgi:hypothetical protein